MEAAEDKLSELEARVLAVESAQVGWVYLPRICAIFGMTKDQVRSRRERGRWTEGVHFAKVEGRIMYNVEAIAEWHTRRASALDPTASQSRSVSSIADARITRRSQSRRRQLV